MADCDIKNPPEFTLEVEKWNRETLADGTAMAAEMEKLLNNTYYNRTQTEKLQAIKLVALPAAGWIGSGPYAQIVAAAGLTADDEPELVKVMTGEETADQVKAYNKAFGFIYYGETRNGEVLFKAYKKPEISLTVGLRGVR